MADQKTPEHDPNAADEHSDYSDYPRATAAEKLTGGMRFEDMRGRWPGDIDDGFEEFIRGFLTRARQTLRAFGTVLVRTWPSRGAQRTGSWDSRRAFPV